MIFRSINTTRVKRVSSLILCSLLLLVLGASASFAHKARHRQRVSAAISDDNSGPLSSATVKNFLSGKYPTPRSHFCILIDARTGYVLYSRNPDVKRAPASLTKIMAAIILLENGKLTDTVVAPSDVLKQPETSLHLKPGEKISLEDLLYAMLMRSANDCPVAGAYYLSGSIPAFVGLMNNKAQELGCTNTHFVTPNGLYDPNHYSTASDISKFTRYAILHLPEFDKIVDTKTKRISRSVDTKDCWVKSTFESFLKFYPGADGVKTGFVSQAGHCFVGSATRNHWRLIAVALDSSDCREDVMQMLSYGFHNFKPRVLMRRGTPEGDLALPGVHAKLPVVAGDDLTDFVSTVPAAQAPGKYSISVAAMNPAPAHFPIAMGSQIGTITLFKDGKAVSSVPALAAQSYNAPNVASLMPMNFKGLAGSLGRMRRAWMIGIVCVIIVIGFSALRYAGPTAKNYRRRRRWFSS